MDSRDERQLVHRDVSVDLETETGESLPGRLEPLPECIADALPGHGRKRMLERLQESTQRGQICRLKQKPGATSTRASARCSTSRTVKGVIPRLLSVDADVSTWTM